MAKPIVIIGAGGHGRVCAEVAQAMGRTVVGFCDDGREPGSLVNGLPILGKGLAQLRSSHPPADHAVFVAIGNNDKRKALSEGARLLGYEMATLIHPSAIVSPSASVGEGSVLTAGAILNANVRVGRSCIVNTAATLDHDCMLEDGVQICPGVHAAGTVTFGALAFVGTGASLIPKVQVGARAVVAAGAAVVRDVPEGATVMGVPARIVPPPV